MSKRIRGALIGLACLACCLPLVLGVLGTTTGVAGAIGGWLGRYEIVVISLIGLGVVVIVSIGKLRSRQSRDFMREKEDIHP